MATMVGAACFAVSGISETLGQEKEKSRPVYIATEEVAETTYTPEVEEATQPTETATGFWLCENHSRRRNRDFIRNGILYGGNRNRPVD